MSGRPVIATDIGTGLDVRAVTAAYGDTDLGARMASTVLGLMGADASVYRGCEQPLSGKVVLWAGHEGVGVPGLSDDRYEPGDAVDVLFEPAAADPGSLDVLAIGPLINIATANRRDPAFDGNVRRLLVMGGEFRNGWPEHNVASDPVATEIVLELLVKNVKALDR